MRMHPITLPAFGSVIPGQGGIFVAIMRGATVDGIEQPPYALLASDAAVGEIESTWGDYRKNVPGATSRRDGLANTEAMIAAECAAAIGVRAMTIAGHSDWYLPSIGELNSAAANVPEIFSQEGLYWTSTQCSRSGAFVQDFEYGGSGWGDKDYEHRVRAFRRIPLELLTA